MEKLEVVGPWSGTEGGSVEPERKVSHEESEKPKEAEMEMDGDVPQEESVEIQSPKRKVIRVETEETQDYVREAKSSEYEEEEERTFVPSAVSVPLKPLFRCDNQCIERTLSCWQLASVVLDEGDKAHTSNLC